MTESRSTFFPSARDRAPAITAGFRFGHVGTHSSRTMMLDELEALLSATPADAKPDEHATAVIEENCLSKQTVANRRHSLQHLRELYGLDPNLPLFRILVRLWHSDPAGRPLLALLAALARDPLLRASSQATVTLPEGAEFQRGAARDLIGKAVGDRLGGSTIEKVVRNTASSWAQSGHLDGRTFKIRRRVKPTPATVAFALYLADAAGFHGHDSLASNWFKVLDCSTSTAMDLALEAKRVGLIDLRAAGDVFELNLVRLDPQRTQRHNPR
jgi:hypothetical protein